jgi:hypothetical protein
MMQFDYPIETVGSRKPSGISNFAPNPNHPQKVTICLVWKIKIANHNDEAEKK